jgi:hypothetical protein
MMCHHPSLFHTPVACTSLLSETPSLEFLFVHPPSLAPHLLVEAYVHRTVVRFRPVSRPGVDLRRSHSLPSSSIGKRVACIFLHFDPLFLEVDGCTCAAGCSLLRDLSRAAPALHPRSTRAPPAHHPRTTYHAVSYARSATALATCLRRASHFQHVSSFSLKQSG